MNQTAFISEPNNLIFCPKQINQSLHQAFDEVFAKVKEISDSPVLLIRLEQVKIDLDKIRNAFKNFDIFYAVKANPSPRIIELLVKQGINFDVASINEIKLCLDNGANPQTLSYGNTVKKAEEVALAAKLGVTSYSVDNLQQLEIISLHAPGSKIIVRINAPHSDSAAWSLSDKFGCADETAIELLIKAKTLNLQPYGLTFHCGSQQLDCSAWIQYIIRAGKIFETTKMHGLNLTFLNVGGGIPSRYDSDIPSLDSFYEVITKSIQQYLPPNIQLAIEPGRALVANCGILYTQVISSTVREFTTPNRWVYIDTGVFNGLVETVLETIKYPIMGWSRDSNFIPTILAGPTCDSNDVIYRTSNYHLPVELLPGAPLLFLNAGAYTYSYSAHCFNGFPPISLEYI